MGIEVHYYGREEELIAIRKLRRGDTVGLGKRKSSSKEVGYQEGVIVSSNDKNQLTYIAPSGERETFKGNAINAARITSREAYIYPSGFLGALFARDVYNYKDVRVLWVAPKKFGKRK